MGMDWSEVAADWLDGWWRVLCAESTYGVISPITYAAMDELLRLSSARAV